ncbi:hypothetical protein [Halobacillus yeomjeoni]|uniref:Uncharacterized protein n=1 Tax=Halobacillus yeomjeoni TaxID=311194 RepID=A0A931HXZ7_9BACI|nr:hypothetical protein [Halobacillus yeomjeoni]MBH0231326.1 hypothetical protein [Halobacillus yeomjeoni]
MKKFSIWMGIGLLIIGTYVLITAMTDSEGPVEPPSPEVSVGEVNIPTTQGSYCWKGDSQGKCVDKAYASEIEMGMNHEPTEIAPGQKVNISFVQDPIEGSIEVKQWNDVDPPKDMDLIDSKITVPEQEGVYVYHIIAEWERGDGSYAFSVEVKD